jgi:hypothetical protein
MATKTDKATIKQCLTDTLIDYGSNNLQWLVVSGQ